MCGIVGLVVPDKVDPCTSELLVDMRDRLSHRGPDSGGLWTQNNVGLGHRRLSVIDTSDAGQQPLTSHNQRWILCYNGEIYNTRELRAALPDVAWRGHCDSEVLVEAIAAWGVCATLAKLNGMFAFAAYDTHSQTLFLARDQVGIKPLYYGVVDGRFVFASEMRALGGLKSLSIDYASITSFMRYRYIPTPHSIYRDIHKLQPGHLLQIDTTEPQLNVEPIAYWQLKTFAEKESLDLSAEEAADKLEHILSNAIRNQLVSDVPIGAFLSGGVDSSLVCAMAAKVSDRPLRTFSIGFDDADLDEAVYARAIASHLGTEHTELYVSHNDLLASMQKLPQLCDEPFADASVLPTLLVSQMARTHVTVALSGDGGDELFWGYSRYATTERIWNQLKPWPRTLRSLTANLLGQSWLQTLVSPVHGIALGGRRGSLAQKFAAASEFLHCSTDAELYPQLLSLWRQPAEILLHPEIRHSVYSDKNHWSRAQSLWPRMANQDLLAYLPDDVLTKVDRASMAVSLEARVPLLDRNVVEFAAQLPGRLKYHNAKQKVLLQHLLVRYVPADLFQRPKAGFGVPLAHWLRGPLREWAEDMLAQPSIRELIQSETIQRCWQDHLTDRADNSAKLWCVLMLAHWLSERPQNQ